MNKVLLNTGHSRHDLKSRATIKNRQIWHARSQVPQNLIFVPDPVPDFKMTPRDSGGLVPNSDPRS